MAAEMTAAKEQAIAEVDRLRPQMEEIAHDIHEHPEVGWDTQRSAGRLTDFLEEHGLKVERGVAGLSSSFRAYPADRFDQHPAVCLLAEYDALPGLGHACGHNLIGTIASAAGIAVSRVLQEQNLDGAVYVMGTPFEEGGGGKIYMINEGVFKPADASLMFHPSNKIGCGSPNIAAHGMKLTFHGRTAHAGAAPHQGINAADAAMLTFVGVNALRQHVTPDVRLHGVILEGGDAPNVTPDLAVVSMMARARNAAALEDVLEKVRNCARAGALATGATLEIEEAPTFKERIVLAEYRRVGLANMRALGIDAPDADPQTFASADSGNVSYEIPHLTFNLPIDTDLACVPHTPQFAVATDSDMAREAMNRAAKVMALNALDLIAQPEVLDAIRAEHARRLSA